MIDACLKGYIYQFRIVQTTGLGVLGIRNFKKQDLDTKHIMGH